MMHKAPELARGLPLHWVPMIGKRFGRLIVIGYTGAKTAFGQKKITCQCSCSGAYVDVMPAALLSGNTTSCGCVHREGMAERNRQTATHGHSRGGKLTPEYRTWASMLTRCYNPKHKSYRDYGGAGIKVCERWRASFNTFLEDVGLRPSRRHSIDRFPDNAGNYEPGNVRWATMTEQNRNQRSTKRFEFRGQQLTLGEIAERVGLDHELLYARIVKRGWTVEDAASKPARKLSRSVV